MEKEMEAGHALEEIEVKPLQYHDIPRVVRNGVKANKPDPLFRYILHDVPDKHKSFMMDKRYFFIYSLAFSEAVRKEYAWTVNHGESFIMLEHAPRDAEKQKGRNKFLTKLIGAISKYLRSLDSKEQKKRQAEYGAKVAVAVKEALGDSVVDMRELEGFATAPEKQQHGYGTALAKHVCAIADAEGKSTWLLSSNIANTPFYESLEFQTVSEFTLGENNPTWKEAPVVLRIMVRRAPGSTAAEVCEETV